MNQPTSYTEVAVGVLIREDGALLYGQRPVGKAYAGWWEFPGGKLEAGESVEQALARELNEELGIQVIESIPWLVQTFVYPHAHVRLHFQKVMTWLGEPSSKEGQSLHWQLPNASMDLVSPTLPASLPAIGWLKLPQYWVLNDLEKAARLNAACVLHFPDMKDEQFIASLSQAMKQVDSNKLWVSEHHAHGLSSDTLSQLAGVFYFGGPPLKQSMHSGSKTLSGIIQTEEQALQFMALQAQSVVVPDGRAKILARKLQIPCFEFS